MSQKVDELAPVILEEIQKAKKILLHCHPSPDPDSVGSTLAMWQYLKNIGKEVMAIGGDSPKDSSFDFLPGYDQIESKNYLEVDTTQFDLFLILDSGDLSRISSIGEVVFPQNLKTIVIDHHYQNPGYAQINLIDADASSTGEVLYKLFKSWNAEITSEMAEAMFVGMYADTGGFKYKGTSPQTLLAAAELVEIYPDFWRAIFEMNNNRAPGEILGKGIFLDHIETYFKGSVAIAKASLANMEKSGVDPNLASASEAAKELISVTGWQIGIGACEKGSENTRFSFRTRDQEKFDVSKIAVATGDGGGHKGASAATIKLPIDKAIEKLLVIIHQVYPELGQPEE